MHVNKNYEVIAIGRVENGLYKFKEFVGNKDVCAIGKMMMWVGCSMSV